MDDNFFDEFGDDKKKRERKSDPDQDYKDLVTNRSQEKGTSPLMQPKKKPPMQKPPSNSNANNDEKQSRRQQGANEVNNSRSNSKNKALPPKGDSKNKNFRINSNFFQLKIQVKEIQMVEVHA